jgi:hypothetical protein
MPGKAITFSSLDDICDSLVQRRHDAGADQFDGLHELLVRQRGGVHHEADAGDAAQRLIVPTDLLDHLFGVADQQGAFRLELIVELGPGDRRPSPLSPDGVEGAGVAGIEVLGGILRGRRDLAEGVYADL